MSGEKTIICSNCGEEVPYGKYCPKCGSLIEATSTEEIEDQLKRITEINKTLNDFKTNTSGFLADDVRNKLEGLLVNTTLLEKKIYHQKQFLMEKDTKATVCFYCHAEVTRTKFCASCGKILGEHVEDEHKSVVDFIAVTQSLLMNLLGMLGKIISNEAITPLRGVHQLLEQIKKRYVLKLRTSLKTVTPSPATPVQPKVVAKPATKTVAKPAAKVRVEDRPDTFWTKLERNLLNYWFFYLAIILFSVGIVLTIYYVVINISSEATQIGIIYAIGAGILLIGQTIAIILRVRAKRKASVESDEKASDKKSKDSPEDRSSFINQMVTVVMFIGIIIIFVAGVLGMASSISVPTGLFLWLSYGFCVITLVIGVLNKSEMITLVGILEIIIYTSVDLLWTQTGSVLNEITSLVFFIIPIILCVLIAIFFKKWVPSIATMAVIPAMLLVPRIIDKVALEFIVLFLIPIMMVLVIQFGSETAAKPFKQSLVILSMLFPAIALIASIFINGYLFTTPSWDSLQAYQIFLACLSILGVAFYYPFIQEKHLEIKRENKVIKILGQLFVGIVAIIVVGVYHNKYTGVLTTILFFVTYYIFGIISSITLIEKETSIGSALLSFTISEILAIVLISTNNKWTTPTLSMADSALLLIIGLSYIILAYLSLFIPKIFEKSKALYSIWIVLSGINLIFLGHLTALNPWFIFVFLIVQIVGALVVNIPVIIPKIDNWRALSILTLVVNAIVLSIFAFTTRIIHSSFAAFTYEGLVIFLLFMAVTIPAFFEWKKRKEVAKVD
ncbi:MAG: zinc ribbon domain-containing protein [Asgard group archaeon]|nr:zinc ribbon domain-containing protein [Asgard group archaeon]